MEQNKFEKDIRGELDGLKINPSESVWNYVEQRIEKKNKRKKAFVLIFLLLLFMSIGGYWFIKSDKNDRQPQEKFQAEEITVPNVNKDTSANESSISKQNKTGNLNFDKALEGVSINSSGLSLDESHKLKSRKSVFVQKNILKSDVENNNELSGKKVEKLQNNLQEESEDLANKNLEKIEEADEKVSEKNAVTESVVNTEESKKIQEPEPDKAIVHSGKINKPVNRKKWSFGITLSGGKSIIANSPLGISNDYNYSDYMSMPGSGSGTGNQVIYFASKPKNSFAFTGGILAEKDISARDKIVIGVNYKYFSTTIDVGDRIASPLALSIYNALSNSSMSTHNGYRNNFNYIEVPVSLKLQLGHSKSFPVYWQGGISFSQLISSNALQYKTNPAIYFNDNSFLNKTQFGFSTGFSTTLFAKQKTPVNIGPHFYYSPSGVANKGLYAQKHFSFIGIAADVLFKK